MPKLSVKHALGAVVSDHQPGDNGVRGLYEAIFEPPAVNIPMQTITEDGNVLDAATIYYSQGELFFLNAAAEGTARNFATVNNNFYTWKGNESTGQQLTRFSR